jgi:hypothetical protein
MGLPLELIMDDTPPEEHPPSLMARLTTLEANVSEIACEFRAFRLEVQLAIQTAVQAAVDKLGPRIEAVEKKHDDQFRCVMTLLVTVLVSQIGVVAALIALAATVLGR